MASMHRILLLLLFCLQWTRGIAQISWENCDKKDNGIELLNLTVNPDPILAPGSVSITITISTPQNITSPLKAILSLKKKLLISYISVPCFSIGSCIYDDLCAICTQCNCPMEAGEHILNLPLTIDSSSWMITGKYQAEINLETSTKQKGCVKITNIDIKTKK